MAVADSRCQCGQPQCPLAFDEPCTAEMTQEDLLCDRCRDAKESGGHPGRRHCHSCNNKTESALAQGGGAAV